MTSKPEDDKTSELLCALAALAVVIGGGNWLFVWPGVVAATHSYAACAPEVRSDQLNCSSVSSDFWINVGFFGLFSAISIFSVVVVLTVLIGLYREYKAKLAAQHATQTPAAEND